MNLFYPLIRKLSLSGLALVCLSTFGAESEIRFGGGHPWLSRNRMIELPHDDVEESHTTEAFGEGADEGNSVPRKKGGKRSVSSGNIHAVSGGRVFDLTIAMYKNRDDLERAKISNIITNFAKGVYEMTEGKHFLGKVSILSNPGYFDGDIKWKSDEPAIPTTKFIFHRSWWIRMYDVLDTNRSYLERPIDGGGTLTHEWGHYEYGFLEEYKGKKKWTVNPGIPRSDDIAVKGSVMAGWNWSGISFEEQCNLSYDVDESADDENQGMWRSTRNTAQFRVFNQSCLRQLKEPVGAVFDGITPVSFKMPKWPEFSNIDPTKPPEIDLDKPDGKAKAIQYLQIYWCDAQKQMACICLDCSGSMQEDQLANAKANTCRVIDTLQDGAMVEVLAFDSSVSTVFSFTELTPDNRAGLKSQVNSLNSGGNTALWDAAKKGVDDMKSRDPDGHYVKSVLLMTDGGDNASSASRSTVVQQCQAAGVAFNSISYGSNADSQLAAASSATGGKNVSSSESLASLSSAFSRLGTYGTDRGAVVDSEGKVSMSGTWTETFTIDSTATNLQATVTLSVPAANASIVLEAPSGARDSAYSTIDVGSESSWVFKQAKPASGTWKIIVTAPQGTSVSCFVDSSAVDEPPQLLVWVDETNMVAYAAVSQGAPVDGARVLAVLNDNGTKREVAFTGVGGGTYLLDLSSCGTFQNGFSVRADAEQGVATYTYVGVMDYEGDDEGTPISESFTRSEWVALGKENAVTFYASGKGKLEFQWRTSGDGMPEKIDFLCNGSTMDTLASGQEWTKKEVVFDADGAHVFQWQTQNEVRKYTGTWLMDVVWHPEPDVAMGPIEVTPRWPWNGLVDIDFSFVPTLAGTKASFAVSGVDGDLGTTIEAKTLSGAYRNLDQGTYRVTWNLGADAPGFHSSAFTVQLDSLVDPLPSPNVIIGSSTASGGTYVMWQGIAPAESYTVFRATNANGTDATPIGSVSIRAADGEWVRFLDSAAPNGKTVWYAVKASAWKLDGDRSPFVSARRPMLPPSDLAATEGTRTDGVRVSWTPSTGTVRSRVFRRARIDESPFDRQFESSWGNAIGETDNSFWLDTTAVPGVDYAYAVSCVSSEGESSALPTGSLDYSPFGNLTLAGTGSGVSGTQSFSGNSPAFGWRNMAAPFMHSPSRTDSQTTQKIEGVGGYGYHPPSWTIYNCTSVFSISWNLVEGATAFRVENWPVDDSSQVESETTTSQTFEKTVKTSKSFAPDIPAGRTFRVTPIGKHHDGLSSEATIE